VGDYFHHVTVGVVEIDAAAAVQMIDLAGLGPPRIGVILDALGADAGERRVKFGVADMELLEGRSGPPCCTRPRIPEFGNVRITGGRSN
jgi:hypothetical protein